ncbi:MAG: RNA methyltransferase [Chlamydiales bacterium]
MLITSRKNPKIKEIKKLWKRSEREESQRFLIEGYREISRAHAVEIESLFYCPEFFLGANESQLIGQIRGTSYRCNKEVFSSISYRDRPDGLLAIAKQFHTNLHEILPSKNPLYIVAESIEKPGNLGTILRSSDATAVDAVIVCDRSTDIYNPNVVRASVGTLFTLPVVEVSGKEAICWLKEQKVKIIAATPSAEIEYTKVDLRNGVAIAVGTEQYGLSRQWIEEADLQVKIPMLGVADSLNVAMATTLLLYEVIRQRSTRSS